MSKRSNGLTEVKIKKWIKEGRGSGRGTDYSPWLRVRCGQTMKFDKKTISLIKKQLV